MINHSGMFNQSGIVDETNNNRERSRIDDLFKQVDALQAADDDQNNSSRVETIGMGTENDDLAELAAFDMHMHARNLQNLSGDDKSCLVDGED